MNYIYQKIFEDTLSTISSDSEILNATSDTANNKQCIYDEPIDIGMYIRREMNIEFSFDGAIANAYRYADNKTALLNFANPVRPCGYVEQGARAQEEDIARCSNLYPILTSKKVSNFYAQHRHEDDKFSDALIYSRDVLILKDEAYNTVEPKKIDVITCSSIVGKYSDNLAYALMSKRAKEVVKSAVINGRDTIILGAWGCGVFGQKPEVIARCFADALKENPYFVRVVFAIKNDMEMYMRFKAEFERAYNGGK